jgi:hypothetical protein
MHAMQVKHLKIKDQIKRLQIKAGEIEEEAIQLGLAERKPTMIEEFRWPKGDVIARWGAEVWNAYKRERIEERFKWK